MGQLQDKVEEKMQDKLQYHLKSFNESINTVRKLEKQKLWPFDIVSPQRFLSALEPFMKATKEAQLASSINFVGVAVPKLKDEIATAAIELTKCIHDMELETIVQDIAELTYEEYDMSQKTNNMMTILAWAQEELYKDNRNVIDFLEPVAQATDRTPILLAQEDTIDYSPGLAIFMIDFLVESHEEAYRRLLASSQEALKYGAPSETLIGQFVDKITDVESIKQQNAKKCNRIGQPRNRYRIYQHICLP